MSYNHENTCEIGKADSVVQAPKKAQGDDLSLYDLWKAVWNGKWIIAASTLILSIVSVIFALSLANIYKSTALLVPSDEMQGRGISALAGQFGGLASLAGINLSNGGDNKVITAIEVIKSRQFAADIINKYDMLVPLMAAKGWDRHKNELIIDKTIYDIQDEVWVRDVSPPKNAKPSMWEAYKEFADILKINLDNATGLVSLSVEHYSPVIAQEWTKIIINEINSVMKEKDVNEAQRSIDYLSQQLEKTSVADMRAVFYQMIEEQSKTIMLAEVRDEYIFSTIDPPVVAEEKAKPARALICILGLLIGGMIGVMVSIIRYFYYFKED